MKHIKSERKCYWFESTYKGQWIKSFDPLRGLLFPKGLTSEIKPQNHATAFSSQFFSSIIEPGMKCV